LATFGDYLTVEARGAKAPLQKKSGLDKNFKSGIIIIEKIKF
jgi:hypothetical protein